MTNEGDSSGSVEEFLNELATNATGDDQALKDRVERDFAAALAAAAKAADTSNNDTMTIDKSTDDSMREFLDELDHTDIGMDKAIDQAKQNGTVASGSSENKDSSNKKKSNTKSIQQKKMKSSSPSKQKQQRKSRPAPIQVASSRVAPSGSAEYGNNNGMSMYERSKLQMEQRELKLRALQEQMMSDYTFTPKTRKSPNNGSFDTPSNGEGHNGTTTNVYDRLYATETKAMKSYRAQTPTKVRSRSNTPNRRGRPTTTTTTGGEKRRGGRRKSGDHARSLTPSRLQALFETGQKQLRSKPKSTKVSKFFLYLCLNLVLR